MDKRLLLAVVAGLALGTAGGRAKVAALVARATGGGAPAPVPPAPVRPAPAPAAAAPAPTAAPQPAVAEPKASEPDDPGPQASTEAAPETPASAGGTDRPAGTSPLPPHAPLGRESTGAEVAIDLFEHRGEPGQP